jgi:hypothetical protein
MKVSITIVGAFAVLAAARPTSEHDKRQLDKLLGGLTGGAGGAAGANPLAGVLGGMFKAVLPAHKQVLI